MKNQILVDFLKERDVCQVCQLRFLKARGSEYKDVKAAFENLHVKYEEPEDDEQLRKKQRLNVCPCCLGLFSTDFQNKLIDGILSTAFMKYDSERIFIAISMPKLLQIRQLGMWFALLREFGGQIDNSRPPDVPLKVAVKLLINPTICTRLNKTYDVNGLMININLTHAQEDEEVACLAELHESAFPRGKSKRQEVSRGLLEKQYTPANVDAKLFEKYLSIPPVAPIESLKLESVSLTGPIVAVAGRYRKICRQLSHTPWILEGRRIIDDSIEEIIARNVSPHFCSNASKVVFMSSGREDVDVRCLGRGRPFALEISDALRTSLPKNTARQMEQEIEKSLKISVLDLQMVQREDLIHIKTGEEKKQKFYRALCKLNNPASIEMLRLLDQPNGFEIQQKTPIRVLHRRPLHTRARTIYSLKAFVIKEISLGLVLDIRTQAGTYIKELVHGEFGRTSPSIASIIGQPIDIVALDVVGIDLDWPPTVINAA